MGLFGGGGSSSSSSSSTSNTSSWMAGLLEPIMTDFINGAGSDGLDYIDSTVAGMTPAEQAALSALGGGASIDAGKSIAGAGAGLFANSVQGISGLLHGGAVDQFKGGVSGLYGAADGFMNTQNAAIQDSVYSQMGSQFGNAAQSNMASTSVAGSSAAQNAQNSVLASGANSMVQQEAALSQKVLAGSIGLTGRAIGGEVGLLDQLMGAGAGAAKAGAGMAAKGVNNQFKAGLFEQYFNQTVANNNRHNDMINSNMDWINMSALLSTVLPAAGIDTTTTGSSTSSTENSKNKGLLAAAGTAAMFL